MTGNWKKGVLLFAICLMSGNILAQSPSIQWKKSYGGKDGDDLTELTIAKDGNYFLGGEADSYDGDVTGNHGADFWIVKADSASGTIIWQKCYGGGSYDQLIGITATNDGGAIACGFTWSNDGDVTGNHGKTDAWVVKVDAQGILQWQKCYGGDLRDGAYSIAVAKDGGYFIAGDAESNNGDATGNHGKRDYWVFKTDSVGAIQWYKCFGGSNDDFANSIAATTDGGCIVAGYTISSDGDCLGNHGNADYLVVKLKEDGTVAWKKVFGGKYNEEAWAIKQVKDGGYIIAGSADTVSGDVTHSHADTDYWLLKLDTAGNKQWDNSYGGNKIDVAQDVAQDVDGGYVLTGSAGSTDGDVIGAGFTTGNAILWTIKTDSLGRLMWQKPINGLRGEYGQSVKIVNGYYIIGGTNGGNDSVVADNHGSFDYWVVKLKAGVLGVGEELRIMNYECRIYPNPNNGNFQLDYQLPANTSAILRIIDITGRTVAQYVLDNNSNSININETSLNSGLYCCQVLVNGAAVWQGKMVVNH